MEKLYKENEIIKLSNKDMAKYSEQVQETLDAICDLLDEKNVDVHVGIMAILEILTRLYQTKNDELLEALGLKIIDDFNTTGDNLIDTIGVYKDMFEDLCDFLDDGLEIHFYREDHKPKHAKTKSTPIQ